MFYFNSQFNNYNLLVHMNANFIGGSLRQS